MNDAQIAAIHPRRLGELVDRRHQLRAAGASAADLEANRLAVAAAVRAQTRPHNYLRPIWRCLPNGTGVAAIALDPLEAAHVLEHGCRLDGAPFTASLDGFDGSLDGDGRISVRITAVEASPASTSDTSPVARRLVVALP